MRLPTGLVSADVGACVAARPTMIARPAPTTTARILSLLVRVSRAAATRRLAVAVARRGSSARWSVKAKSAGEAATHMPGGTEARLGTGGWRLGTGSGGAPYRTRLVRKWLHAVQPDRGEPHQRGDGAGSV